MLQNKILPYSYPPPIKCYLPFTIISSIAKANLNNNSWVINNFIQLYKYLDEEKFESFPMQDFMYFDQDCLRVNEMNNFTYEFERKNFIRDVINWINKDNYVVIYVNEQLIPGTRMYKKEKLLHSQFVIGYDLKKEVFIVLNFSEQKNDLDIINVSFTDMEEAFFSQSTWEMYQKSSLPWIAQGKTHRVELIRFINNKGVNYTKQINKEYILFEIENYVLGRNSSFYTNYFTGHMQGVWGMNIYEEVLRILGEKREKIDIRLFKLLYEHKVYMKQRIMLFEKTTSEIEEGYERVKNYADLLFKLCIKYNITKSLSVLDRMQQNMMKMYEEEKECLMNFITLNKEKSND